jgi:chromosome segregation ATPase
MDERNKQIEELEQRRREHLAGLDSLLERLGASLLVCAGDDSPDAAGEYRRLQKEIGDSETAIQTIEEQIRLKRELEAQIASKEQEEGERSKSLAALYGALGKALLEADTGAGGIDAPAFREQSAPLIDKVRSLEDRLAELEQKEGGNVFSWIGKSAQGLVLRSFLTKAQDNLEQLYRSAGEHYSRQDCSSGESAAPPPEITPLLNEINVEKEHSRNLSGVLAGLRAERRSITDSFGAEGNPLKQIQTLKSRIAQAREELQVLYRHFGDRASAAATEGAAAIGAAATGESRITADDQTVLDDIVRIRQLIGDDERSIEKLRASLAIDEEQAKIEKCRKLIEDKKARIAEAEKDIAEFEEGIKDSEKYIEELRKLL